MIAIGDRRGTYENSLISNSDHASKLKGLSPNFPESRIEPTEKSWATFHDQSVMSEVRAAADLERKVNELTEKVAIM